MRKKGYYSFYHMEETPPPRQFEFYTPAGNRNSSLHVGILYGIYYIMFFLFYYNF